MIGVVLMVMPYILGKTLSLGLQRNNPQLLTHPLRLSGFESQSPSILWFDNIGAITYVFNPLFHACTKHIELDYHFAREQLSQETIQVHFLFGDD